jgi:hypothetical protein
VRLPPGHELIHQRDEPLIVGRFEQVCHFVNDYVPKASPWLFGEIGIQSDSGRAVIAATPFRLHSLHEQLPHRYSH